MKKRRIFAILLALCLVVMMAAGCSSGQETTQSASPQQSEKTTDTASPEQSESAGGEEQLTFALLPKTLSNPYFVAMQDYATAKAEELGVKIECTAPPQETDVDQQISMFESMLEKGVDGILIVPCGSKEIVASIEKANEMGVPVICLDTNAEGGEVASFIGTNNYEGGKLAGEWLGETLGEGKVGIITGTPGNNTHEDRVNGFKEGVAETAGLEIVGDALPAYSERAQGMSQAENLLAGNPDIKAIYCTNDQMALGAGEAVKAAGKQGEILVIGFDGAPEAAQGILDGMISASVAQKPGGMGEMGVQAMYDLIVEGKTLEAVVDTGCTIVSKDNAQDYLDWH